MIKTSLLAIVQEKGKEVSINNLNNFSEIVKQFMTISLYNQY